MLFPIIAFVLAIRGEFGVGDANESGFRVFLLNDNNLQGIGIERRRRINSEDNCLQSTLNYLLWEGENDNLDITFCQCFEDDTGFADPSHECQPFQ